MNTLIQRFVQTESTHSDVVALWDKDNSTTYGELVEQVKLYASRLAMLGVNKGDPVVIVFSPSAHYICMFYALWYLGAVPVPLDQWSKPRELNKVQKLLNNCLLLIEDLPIHQREMSQTQYEFNRKNVIFINKENWQATPVNHLRLTPEQILPEDLAQIIFTSGTTGNPKGIQLSHKNILANTQSIVQSLDLSERDCVYQVLPFHYSYGNSVLHTHFYVRGSLFFGSPMQFPNMVSQDLVTLPQITGFSGVPSTYEILLNHTEIEKEPLKLRYFTQAGGPMSPGLQQRILQVFPDIALYIMYGQTEASARLSYLPPDMINQKFGSVGIGIPDVQLEVINEHGEFCPNGEEGEVIARGANIMLGYWQNEQSTAETIINGWLHTGDLGFKDQDGYLFLKGRKNLMIKSGAHRIHPTEIEEVAVELPFVSEAAVIGWPDETLGEVIYLFAVADDEHHQNTQEVMRYFRSQLPMHKQPKHLQWIDNLPKTASGKIQRHLLLKKEVHL